MTVVFLTFLILLTVVNYSGCQRSQKQYEVVLENLRFKGNPEYFTASVNFTDDLKINVQIEIIKFIDAMTIHTGLASRVLNNMVVLTNFTFDYCSVTRNFGSGFLLPFIYEEILKYSNIPPGCPIPSGKYYVKDFQIPKIRLPFNIPISGFEFSLTAKDKLRDFGTSEPIRYFGIILDGVLRTVKNVEDDD